MEDDGFTFYEPIKKNFSGRMKPLLTPQTEAQNIQAVYLMTEQKMGPEGSVSVTRISHSLLLRVRVRGFIPVRNSTSRTFLRLLSSLQNQNQMLTRQLLMFQQCLTLTKELMELMDI